MIDGGKYASQSWVGCSEYDEANPPTRPDIDLLATVKSVSNISVMVLKRVSECGVEFCDTALVVMLWSLCSFQYDQILDSSVCRAVGLDILWSMVRFPLKMTFS